MLVGLPILLRILFGVAAPGSLNMIPCKSACFGAALAIAVLSGCWLSIVVEDLVGFKLAALLAISGCLLAGLTSGMFCNQLGC